MPSPSFQVVNPATGEESAPHPFITDTELEAVLSTARDIQREWASWAAPARAKILNDVARYHRDNLEELATIAVREMGKPITQARAEVEFSADIYDYYADNGTAFLADEPIAVSGSGSALIRKQPIGTVLGIMPWNFPYYQVARFAAPALMAGNSVLLKPAPQCPDSSAAIASAFSVAPQGVFTRILASESAIANLIEDTRVAGVSFTGSARAGAIVGGLAGAAVKKTVLELGGSDPFVVLDVTSVHTVVEAAVEARLDNSGQSCNGAKRIIVIDRHYDDFVRQFVERLSEITPADPILDDTVLGPLSSADAAERLEAQVQRAIANGATALLAPERRGAFHGCGVLADVTADNPVHREELFGPVAVLYRAADEGHAVEIANDTPFGLGSYVYTDDLNQANRVANALDTGMVYINGVGQDAVELPFGGTKQSGVGRELGSLGIREFVNHQLIRTVTY